MILGATEVSPKLLVIESVESNYTRLPWHLCGVTIMRTESANYCLNNYALKLAVTSGADSAEHTVVDCEHNRLRQHH